MMAVGAIHVHEMWHYTLSDINLPGGVKVIDEFWKYTISEKDFYKDI